MKTMQAAAAVRAGVRRKNRVMEHWRVYLMMVPAIVYMLLFHYKPIYGVIIAFKDYSFGPGIWGSEWVGLANFARLFKSYWFPVIVKNTFTISLLTLAVTFPLPILLALMVNEVENKHWKNCFQTVTYAPHFISTVVLCGIVLLFLDTNTGIVNYLIRLLGLPAVDFMQTPGCFKWIYVLSGVWQSTGWSTIIYFAALSGIDRSIQEAAEIDGATRVQKIIYINFPVLVPTIITLFILRCGSLLSVGYEKVFLLQTPGNLPSSEIISTYVYKLGMQQYDFSFSTAVGLLNSVVNSAILILTNGLSKKFTSTSLW